MNYPARFEPDVNGGYSVTFRDIPEAITQGDTLEEARHEAVAALVTAMDFYFEDNRSVPAPSVTGSASGSVAETVKVLVVPTALV